MTFDGTLYDQIAERVKQRIRDLSRGGCRVVSRGDGCDCALCDIDRLLAGVALSADGSIDMMDPRVWTFCHAKIHTYADAPHDVTISVHNEDGSVWACSLNAWRRLQAQTEEKLTEAER